MVGASWSACHQNNNSHFASYKPAYRHRAHESAVGPKLNSEIAAWLAAVLTSEYDP
jgi:hypothetical protein